MQSSGAVVSHSTNSGQNPSISGTTGSPKPVAGYQDILKQTPQEKSKQQLGKKVEIIQQTKQDSVAVLDYFPSRFNHTLTQPYVDATKIAAQQAGNKSCANPYDFNLRCDLVYRLLLLAEIYQKLKQKATLLPERIKEHANSLEKYLSMAKIECEQAKKLNSLDARYYNVEAMIMEFEGVDSKNIVQVEKYIHLLQLALAFDPTSTETKQRLDQAVIFSRKRWAELKQNGSITDQTYLFWTTKLNVCLGQNVLKELFRSNPQLFKFSSNQTHTQFFNLHPELKSVNAFLEKYPEEETIQLMNDKLTPENVRQSLAQAENNPFARNLYIDSTTAILTPVIAHEIKEGILQYFNKQKILKVCVCNKNDAITIINAFHHDNTLVKGKGKLECNVFQMKKEAISFQTYILSMALDSPFIRN